MLEHGKQKASDSGKSSTTPPTKPYVKDTIETNQNEVYGASTDGIETTPNEMYGVSTDGIETTPNEVYGVSTHPLQGHVYEDVKSIRESSAL